MNTDSIDAQVFDSFVDAEEHGPGAIYWFADPDLGACTMGFIIPGEDCLRAIEVSRDKEEANQSRVWLLTGPKEKPTLSPSINAMDTDDPNKSVWHGYLRDGRFQSC